MNLNKVDNKCYQPATFIILIIITCYHRFGSSALPFQTIIEELSKVVLSKPILPLLLFIKQLVLCKRVAMHFVCYKSSSFRLENQPFIFLKNILLLKHTALFNFKIVFPVNKRSRLFGINQNYILAVLLPFHK